VQRCELNETRDERELKVVTVVTVECERDNQADLKMKTLFFYWILMYHTTCVPSVHVHVQVYTLGYIYLCNTRGTGCIHCICMYTCTHTFSYTMVVYITYYTCVKSKKVKCV
jgi:hypothetical protein